MTAPSRSSVFASHVAAAAVIAVLAVFMISAVTVRLLSIDKQFSNTDDVGVAISIVESRRTIGDIETLRQIINNPAVRQHESGKFRLLRQLDGAGVLGPIFNAVRPLRDALAVPLRWSYAPAQFFITAQLIANDAPFERNLAAGRLPSTVASLLTIFLIGLYAWRMASDRNDGGWVLALAIAALSLELLIFSLNMSNYAAGVLASVLIIALLFRFASMGQRPFRHGLLLGLALLGLFFVTYQTLLLIPAFFAAVALHALLSDREFSSGMSARIGRFVRSKTLKMLGVAGVVIVAGVLPSSVLLLSTIRPITWNAGHNNEFVYSWSHSASFLDGLGYTVRFFTENFVRLFAAMVGPVPEDSMLYWPIAAVFLGLFVLGLVSALRAPLTQLRFLFGCFAILVVFTLFGAALVGAVALSPTRHALLFLPIFALGAGLGLSAVLESISADARLRSWMSVAVLVGLWVVWLASIPAVLKERSIPFNEQAIAKIVDETGAKTIVGYAFTNYSELMPSVRDRVAIYDDQNMSFPWFGNRRPDAAAPILFMSQNMQLTADVFRQLLSRINTTLPSETRWNFCFDEDAFRFRSEQRSQVSYEAVANPDSTRNHMFFYVFDPMRAPRQC